MPASTTTKQVQVRYSAPVTNCQRRLLVAPPPKRGSQLIIQERWACDPPPDNFHEETDAFGNRVLVLSHGRIQHSLNFKYEVETERVDIDAPKTENLPESGLGGYALASALCDLAPAIVRMATDLQETKKLPTGKQSAEAASALAAKLCHATYAALAYTPGATGIETTASQALGRGTGVCQDYAHLMIALARACRLPARYISGYNPSEGGMHAWVEVLCGERWLAFDPTHDRRTRADCVFVAAGRDFRDVPPMQASYRGRAKVQVTTRSVTVTGRNFPNANLS